jgi:hypothetical protein
VQGLPQPHTQHAVDYDPNDGYCSRECFFTERSMPDFFGKGVTL